MYLFWGSLCKLLSSLLLAHVEGGGCQNPGIPRDEFHEVNFCVEPAETQHNQSELKIRFFEKISEHTIPLSSPRRLKATQGHPKGSQVNPKVHKVSLMASQREPREHQSAQSQPQGHPKWSQERTKVNMKGDNGPRKEVEGTKYISPNSRFTTIGQPLLVLCKQKIGKTQTQHRGGPAGSTTQWFKLKSLRMVFSGSGREKALLPQSHSMNTQPGTHWSRRRF